MPQTVLTVQQISVDFRRSTKGLYPRKFSYAAFMVWFGAYRAQFAKVKIVEGKRMRPYVKLPAARAVYRCVSPAA